MLFTLTETSPRVLIWCNPDQVNVAMRSAELAGLTIAAAGSPATGQTGLVAGALRCRPCDDLRADLVAGEVEGVLLMTMEGFGGEADARAVTAANARGVRIFALEPPVVDLTEWKVQGEDGVGAPSTIIRPLGLMRRMRRYREFEEVLRDFGTIRSVTVAIDGPANEGTLSARLVSAIDCVLGLIGEPSVVHGAMTAGQARGEHVLGRLRGECGALLRFDSGEIASVMVCDQQARHDFEVVVRGPSGSVRFETTGMKWVGADGVVREDAQFGSSSSASGARLMAEEFSRHLYPGAVEQGPVRWSSVLATAQAVVLSVKTGQAESPHSMRRMSGLAE